MYYDCYEYNISTEWGVGEWEERSFHAHSLTGFHIKYNCIKIMILIIYFVKKLWIFTMYCHGAAQWLLDALHDCQAIKQQQT
jgi:hypothetical protein